MSLIHSKTVELVGGPLDGKVVVVQSHIKEFQKTRNVASWYIYVETVHENKQGHHVFQYQGVSYE